MGTITRNLAYNVLTGGVINRPLIENASIANATSIPAALTKIRFFRDTGTYIDGLITMYGLS